MKIQVGKPIYAGALDHFCFTFGDRIFLMTQISSRLACAFSMIVLLTTFEYCFDMVPYMHLVRAYHTPIKGWYEFPISQFQLRPTS